MMRPLCGGLVLALLILDAGCSKPEPAAEEAGSKAPGGESQPAAGEQAEAHLFSRDVPKQQSMQGRWLLLFFPRGSGAEVPAALLDVAKSSKDSKLRVNVRQFGPSLANPTLKQSQATDTSVRLGFQMAVQRNDPRQGTIRQVRSVDILVELRDGEARGNAQFSAADSFLVAMVPTKLETLQQLRPQVLPEMSDLKSEKPDDKQEAIQKSAAFVKAHPDSPLTIDIYPFIIRTASERKLDEAAVNAAADEFAALSARWGTRQELRARIDAAAALLATSYLPRVAIKQIDLAAARLNEESIPIWKSALDDRRQTALTILALDEIHAGSDEQRAKAAESLRGHNKKQPYDPIVMFELASYDEAKGKKDAALRGYAELTVLPLLNKLLVEIWKSQNKKLPAPSESASRLWKELHGGKTDGYEKYLDAVYADAMPKFTGKPIGARPLNPENRVVLCELFTGTGCPTCVAADLAFEQLLKTYSPTELIALQYHQHIPEPDPLANDETEARRAFYDVNATPTFCVSGVTAQLGGLLKQTPDVYQALHQAVDQILARQTSVRIRLKAEPKGNVVAVTAEADGSFPPNEPIRLRLALAEENVSVRGSNGIRNHEMVVRTMPGGPRGIEMKDGKLVYQGTIDLKAVRQQIDDYLTAMEQGKKAAFPLKPLELSRLHLIAFVQNDRSREVYQAAVIPLPKASVADAKTPPKSTAAAR